MLVCPARITKPTNAFIKDTVRRKLIKWVVSDGNKILKVNYKFGNCEICF